MKHFLWCALAGALLVVAGCETTSKMPHGPNLPDPQQFNAHFGDIDSDDDGMVRRDEFKQFFPQAQPTVFTALDLNQDGVVDHDEWHKFKEAHGLKHKY